MLRRSRGLVRREKIGSLQGKTADYNDMHSFHAQQNAKADHGVIRYNVAYRQRAQPVLRYAPTLHL